MTYEANGRQYVVIAAGGHDRLTLGPPALGDYVMAFALDAPGPARSDSSGASALAGPWTGELRIDDQHRYPLEFVLRQQGDSLHGRTAGRIVGPIAFRRSGDSLSLAFDFQYPEKRCAGRISGSGNAANGDALLVGTLEVHSTCSEHDEPGAFSFRRPAR
jgi:hypothetical protein